MIWLRKEIQEILRCQVLIRHCLMGLFVAYWVIFIFYTVEKFITGGSSAVVGWYRHIDSSVLQRGDGCFFEEMELGDILGSTVRNPCLHFGAVFHRTTVEADAKESVEVMVRDMMSGKPTNQELSRHS